MKPLLITIVLSLCTCALAAQDKQNVVKESETDNNYFFRVHLENGRSSQLMHCMNTVTESNINVRMKGELTLNVDTHSELNIDTRDRVLTIEHSGSEPAERERIKQLVVQTKECLNIPLDSTTGI